MVFDKWVKNWKTAIAENFFLRMIIILLSVLAILNTTVLKRPERIILVPPTLTESAWIDKTKASKSYQEQMAVFFATFAGNLSPNNAEYNVTELIKYVHPKRVADVKADLAAQAVYIKKNNISQSFYPKDINVDEDKKEVTIEGDVVRGIGTTKVSQEKMIFHVKFVFDNYKLYLDDFYSDYPERSKTKMKEKGVLTDVETIKEQQQKQKNQPTNK